MEFINTYQTNDLFQYISYEIINSSVHDNTITILSFCSGSANYESLLLSYLKKFTDKEITLILYDTIYTDSYFAITDEKSDIISKFSEDVNIYLCNTVAQINNFLPNKLHCILGFNIQEAYSIPKEYMINAATVINFLKEEKNEKSINTLCELLISKYKNINDILFYVYKNKINKISKEYSSLELEFNNFKDFNLDVKKRLEKN